jgi:predicted nuclease of predicted toxin-antitoxin system
MHRLFLDQNIRIEIAEPLRKDGHTVVHATEAGLRERDDERLFRWAVENRLTLVTFDVDFADRAYWGREPHLGIVRLRLEPQTPEHVLPILRRFLGAYSPEDMRNALVILTEKKIRIRRW